MYLDPPSSLAPSSMAPVEPVHDPDLRQQLWARVRTVLPALSASSLRVDETGGDHVLLIVDEARAIRFPRPGRHGMDLEIKVLAQLRPHARIALPAYDVVDPNGRFAGYPLIPGAALTPARFASLSRDAGRGVLADVVSLLRLLHAIDPRADVFVEDWPQIWSPSLFADRIEDRRLPLLAGRFPAISELIPAFLSRYRTDRAPVNVVLHGDLVGDHLLIDEATGTLAGIIDFSDVALGDPAHDLLGFWAYGAGAAAHAVKCYDAGDADPGLFARSRNHFIRYRIDRLYEAMVDGTPDELVERHADTLTGLIATSSQLPTRHPGDDDGRP